MKLSVIVVVYNGEPLITECLESIAAQTYRDLELIIVDDGSTDGTALLLRDFARNHPEMVLRVITQQNLGTAQARRAGVLQASGEFIGFVDADDRVRPAYYEEMMAAAAETGCDMVCSSYTENRSGRCRRIAQDRELLERSILSPREARMAVLQRRAVYQFLCNKVIRRELLTRIQYPEGNLIGEDLGIMLQLLESAKDIAVVECDGYEYRIHDGSMSRQGFGPEKKRGYENYRSIREHFQGTAEEHRALDQYLMLEYMWMLLSMYRGGSRDEGIEKEILDFVRRNRRDYLRRSSDRPAAKLCAAVLSPRSARVLRRIWPRRQAPQEQATGGSGEER